MRLKAKLIGISSGGKPIVLLNKEDAAELGVRGLDRVTVKYDKTEVIAIVNITSTLVNRGEIGIFEELDYSKLKENKELEVKVANPPNSLHFIREKLKGRKLTYDEIHEIVNDTVKRKLNDIEIASFVTALHNFGLDLGEAKSLSLSMVDTGERLKLNKKLIVDKHSIGGCAGDKTTLLLVPIVAAADLTIPKTSSRAITSAAGTADRAEAIMPVSLDIDQMKDVVEKTNGCIVWGGSLHLSPADDIFIEVEYPLSIDPLLLPSVMSKKKAVGANFLVIDIPTGRGTKVKTIGDADLLAKDFITLGGELGIKTHCALTFGEQPIGHTIGPALEAKEALEVLMRKRNTPDLIDKATDLAGILFEMVGKKNGKELAVEMLKSGKAEEKMREIIMHQGGDSEIKPEDIKIGEFGLDVTAKNSGIVLWIDNNGLIEVARAAGSPKDKGAGIHLYKKLGDRVEKDQKLFTVYAEKSTKLERVKDVLEHEESIIGVGQRMEMLIHEVKEIHVHKRPFILER
jgi:AMP phosphorylase